MQKASAPPEDCVVTDCAVWSGSSSRRYPPDLRERAARMVAASSDQHESGVGGDRRGCPAVASCWHPQGPSPADSHHQYESINRTDPSTVVGYRSSSRAPCDRRARSRLRVRRGVKHVGGRPAPHPADQSRRDHDPPVGVSTAAIVTTAATATPIHHAAIAVSTPLLQTPCRSSAARAHPLYRRP